MHHQSRLWTTYIHTFPIELHPWMHIQFSCMFGIYKNIHIIDEYESLDYMNGWERTKECEWDWMSGWFHNLFAWFFVSWLLTSEYIHVAFHAKISTLPNKKKILKIYDLRCLKLMSCLCHILKLFSFIGLSSFYGLNINYFMRNTWEIQLSKSMLVVYISHPFVVSLRFLRPYNMIYPFPHILLVPSHINSMIE